MREQVLGIAIVRPDLGGLAMHELPDRYSPVVDKIEPGSRVRVFERRPEGWWLIGNQRKGEKEECGWSIGSGLQWAPPVPDVPTPQPKVISVPSKAERDARFWFIVGLIVITGVVTALYMTLIRPARAADLPDPVLTPGLSRGLSLEEICETRWGTDKRAVTQAMKMQVFRSYGLPAGNKPTDACPTVNGQTFEIDHLIPRCAGGADDVRNLSPQCYAGDWNAHMKDRLETKVCKLLCDGELDLADVPGIFVPDWRPAWKLYFGKDTTHHGD